MTDLTQITTVLGCLDGEPRVSLMQHGGPYEVFSVDGWRAAPSDPEEWSDCYAYRVKPSPPEPREWWLRLDANGDVCGTDPAIGDPPPNWVLNNTILVREVLE